MKTFVIQVAFAGFLVLLAPSDALTGTEREATVQQSVEFNNAFMFHRKETVPFITPAALPPFAEDDNIECECRGYASTLSSEDPDNEELSYQRAKHCRRWAQSHMKTANVIARGYGTTEQFGPSFQTNQRAELRCISLKKVPLKVEHVVEENGKRKLLVSQDSVPQQCIESMDKGETGPRPILIGFLLDSSGSIYPIADKIRKEVIRFSAAAEKLGWRPRYLLREYCSASVPSRTYGPISSADTLARILSESTNFGDCRENAAEALDELISDIDKYSTKNEAQLVAVVSDELNVTPSSELLNRVIRRVDERLNLRLVVGDASGAEQCVGKELTAEGEGFVFAPQCLSRRSGPMRYSTFIMPQGDHLEDWLPHKILAIDEALVDENGEINCEEKQVEVNLSNQHKEAGGLITENGFRTEYL